MIVFFFLLWSLDSASAGSQRPVASIYWLSSPTHANETLLIAGAGLDQVVPKVCRDAACHTVIDKAPHAASWHQSLSLVLPDACSTPPCYLVLDQAVTGDTLGDDTTIITAVNSPDVWWGLSGAPFRHSHGCSRGRARRPVEYATCHLRYYRR